MIWAKQKEYTNHHSIKIRLAINLIYGKISKGKNKPSIKHLLIWNNYGMRRTFQKYIWTSWPKYSIDKTIPWKFFKISNINFHK